MFEKSVFRSRAEKVESKDDILMVNPAPNIDARLKEALEVADTLTDRVRELHHAQLEHKGVDISKAHPFEVRASETAAMLEWLNDQTVRVRQDYDTLIQKLEKRETVFSRELNADRFRQS